MRVLFFFLAVVTQCYLGSGQRQGSVAQQCLSQQIRDNQNTVSPRVVNGGRRARVRNNAQTQTLTAFRSICQNFDGYVRCFEERIRDSRFPDDQFQNYIFDGDDMRAAYRGLCGDLPDVEENVRCLNVNARVQRCYDNFEQSVLQVVNIGRQNRLSQWDLQNLACNVSISRYQCETQEYTRCNTQVGYIMRNFFFAVVPAQCRRVAGVTSRYSAMFNRPNGAETTHVSTILLIVSSIGALLRLVS